MKREVDCLDVIYRYRSDSVSNPVRLVLKLLALEGSPALKVLFSTLPSLSGSKESPANPPESHKLPFNAILNILKEVMDF